MHIAPGTFALFALSGVFLGLNRAMEWDERCRERREGEGAARMVSG